MACKHAGYVRANSGMTSRKVVMAADRETPGAKAGKQSSFPNICGCRPHEVVSVEAFELGDFTERVSKQIFRQLSAVYAMNERVGCILTLPPNVGRYRSATVLEASRSNDVLPSAQACSAAFGLFPLLQLVFDTAALRGRCQDAPERVESHPMSRWFRSATLTM